MPISPIHQESACGEHTCAEHIRAIGTGTEHTCAEHTCQKQECHVHPEHHLAYPHIGMRKIKSILAIFVGFCLWQVMRLFLPGLEVHPIFIYIYGMIEIRETSEKTKDYGRMRIMATFTSILIGLPIMLLSDWISPKVEDVWHQIVLEIVILIVGALLVLCVAEAVKCRVYCGLAAAIYMILMISHFEDSMYLYSIMRAFQTIIGVSIAWIINVKLLPYPTRPGTLSYWLESKKQKRRMRRMEA